MIIRLLYFSLSLLLITSCSVSKQEIVASEEIKDDSGALKVMTYNIARMDHDKAKLPDSPHVWEVRKDRVIKLIKTYNPDIIGVQEDLPIQSNDLCIGLDYSKTGVSKSTGTIDGKGIFNAIYYDHEKLELRDKGHFFLSETPDKPGIGWDAQASALCNWAKFYDKRTKKEFFFFNTHMDYKLGINQSESSKLIERMMDKYVQGNPVILTGDMNSAPDSDAIKYLNTFLSSAYKVGKSVLGPRGTFNNFDPNYDYNKYMIDYIFVSNHFDVMSTRVVADIIDNFFPSDHFPIFSEIKIESH